MKGGDIPAFMKPQPRNSTLSSSPSPTSGTVAARRVPPISESSATRRSTAVCATTMELYARKDIDAVIIATADFQHAQHGIEAVKQGRDAYDRKPTAHTMAGDARAFLKAVNRRQAGHCRWHTAPLHSQLHHRSERVHQVRQVRRHRHGRDELERQPTWPLALRPTSCLC